MIFVWLLLCSVVFSSVINIDFTKEQLQHLENDPPVTHIVSFEITKYEPDGDADTWGMVGLALFGETVPLTVANFVNHASATELGYTNSIFHRIVKDFMVQGGNLIRTESDYGKVPFERFEDENFVLKHNKKGRVSMANSGPNSNGAQFFITTGSLSIHLDGHHVVFGQVVAGFDVLDRMNDVRTTKDNDKPYVDVAISKVVVTDFLVNVSDESLSRGYLVFIFFCLAASVSAALFQWNRRRQMVPITSFRM